MNDESDIVSPDRVKEGLDTKILGSEIISYLQISSTNDTASDLAIRGSKEGTLVLAECQTKGKGRRGRTWISPAGTSILASLILRPSIMAHEAHVITMISATAVAQAIRRITHLHAMIKWPNDVVINGKKVAGILSEMRIKDKIDFIVTGIGVNVNQSDFPLEIADIATSLRIESGQYVPRIPLLQEILRQLEIRYVKLKNRDFSEFTVEWKNISATIGHPVRIDITDRVIHGQALDIDGSGALLVQTDAEIQRIIYNDDVTQVRITKLRDW